jgi:hypothetical protein
MLVASTLQAQPLSGPDIREALTAYIDRFVGEYTNVVAEEVYIQEADRQRGKRTLRSHFVVVRYPGSQIYVFRDAFEVDGTRTRNPEVERLRKFFDKPTTESLLQAQEVSNETSRHYIREIGTLNNPLLVISLLQRANRHRTILLPGGRERKLGPTIRTVSFKEVVTPTMLRWGGSVDLPAEGKLWVDEQGGRIVKTELKLGEREMKSQSTVYWRPPTVITVTFGRDEELGIDVPVEMRDTYPMDQDEVRGVATYSRFRRLRLGDLR